MVAKEAKMHFKRNKEIEKKRNKMKESECQVEISVIILAISYRKKQK